MECFSADSRTSFHAEVLAIACKGRLPQENFQRGEGLVTFDPKNIVADFSIQNEHFSFLTFWKKRGGHCGQVPWGPTFFEMGTQFQG